MNANTKYLVLSVSQLRNMLAVAETISTLYGPSHTEVDCVIYGLSDDGGQLSFKSARPVESDVHFLPGNQLDGEPIIYRGDYLTR